MKTKGQPDWQAKANDAVLVWVEEAGLRQELGGPVGVLCAIVTVRASSAIFPDVACQPSMHSTVTSNLILFKSSV